MSTSPPRFRSTRALSTQPTRSTRRSAAPSPLPASSQVSDAWASVCSCLPRVVADHVELGHELNAAGLRHPALHLGDEVEHVAGGGTGVGLEEVGVLLGHHSPAHAQALEPGGVDAP